MSERGVGRWPLQAVEARARGREVVVAELRPRLHGEGRSQQLETTQRDVGRSGHEAQKPPPELCGGPVQNLGEPERQRRVRKVAEDAVCLPVCHIEAGAAGDQRRELGRGEHSRDGILDRRQHLPYATDQRLNLCLSFCPLVPDTVAQR